VIAPSQWAARTLQRYFPEHAADVIAHGTPGAWAAQTSPDGGDGRSRGATRMAVVLPDDDVPTVAVLGAIGPDKGARRLDRMVELVRAHGLRLRFALIGYLDRLQTPWQSEDAVFTVHGRYDPRDLPDLLAHYRVRLVAYPSAGPETFSLTLSEAWAAGRPVLVPPIGALAERVAGTGAGWILAADEWRDDARVLARIAGLVAPDNAAQLAAAAQCARGLRQPAPAQMAEQTLAVYRRALARAPGTAPVRPSPPFAPARVRDALGYAPWRTPPAVAPVVPASREGSPKAGFVAGAVTIAMRLGPTLPGRVLRRLTPGRVLEALKARLP